MDTGAWWGLWGDGLARECRDHGCDHQCAVLLDKNISLFVQVWFMAVYTPLQHCEFVDNNNTYAPE